MFTIVKKAKMSKDAALRAGHTTKEVGDWDKYKIPGTKYFGWDFTTVVLGCGDEPPADFEPNDVKSTFKVEDDYAVDDLVRDIQLVVEMGYDLKKVVDAVNGGIDLQDRAKAPPKPAKKMTDNDKCGWVIANAPRGKVQACKDVTAYVKLYAELHE